MNPWAALIILIALVIIVIAWKGTQDNVIAAVLNRPYKNSTVGQGAPGASQQSVTGTGSTNPPVVLA